MGDLLKNIVTFGAHGRIQNKMHEYDDIICELKEQEEETDKIRKMVNKQLEQLVDIKIFAAISLKKVKNISKNLTPKDRQFSSFQYDKISIDDSLAKIEHTISLAETAVNASKGVGAGVSTALGAWALVTGYGAASTGTAIATLSGAAATNATLAFFGGGSLAVGGLGVAGGTAVLGGIVALPALLLTGIFSHLSANKKIREIEEKMCEIIEAIDQNKAMKLAIELMGERANEITISTQKANKAFLVSYNHALKTIYPTPILSRLYKWLKKLFGHNYYSENDLQEIAQFGKIAQEFAMIIDTKLMDQNGNLI